MEKNKGIFAVIDQMDAKGFAEFLSKDCVLRFGNMDEVVGRDNIENALSGFFSTIDGMQHHIVDSWTVETTTIAQLEVTYYRKDGRQVTVPVVSIYRMDKGLIEDYRIYIDLEPVFAEQTA